MKTFLLVGSFCALALYAQLPQIKIANAASFQQSAGISPGAIVVITGNNLSAISMIAPDPTHLSTNLGGATVTVANFPSAIYSVSPAKIVARIDPSVLPGQQQVSVNTPVTFATALIQVEAPSSVGLFTLNGAGSGPGAILNAQTLAPGPFSVTSSSRLGTGPTYLALFGTGLDSSNPPAVSIAGVPVPVLFWGEQPLYPGMQQINVQLTPELAGLGHAEAVVKQHGRTSNAADLVLLPQQPVFPNDQANQFRSRELAAVAWVPGSSTVLVADENDDVVRVVDLQQKRITHVIALPDGAQPSAIGVRSIGDVALVAERGRGSVALIDLANYVVKTEYPVGPSPWAIVVAADEAVIASADSDTATFFDFHTLQVVGTAATGRLPRSLAADSQNAYAVNESDGTITVLNLTTHSATNTIQLGVDVRPGAIQVLPDIGLAVISEPSAGANGKLWYVNLATGAVAQPVVGSTSPITGACGMASSGGVVYFASPAASSVAATGLFLNGLGVSLVNPAKIPSDAGICAMAVDPRDNLLAAIDEAAGTLVLIDLSGPTQTARIDAVRTSASDQDDHADRLSAPNLPTLLASSIQPASGQVATTVRLSLNGTHLDGATGVLFIDPAAGSSLSRASGDQSRGNPGANDPGIVVSNILVSSGGTQLSASVTIQNGHRTGSFAVRVLTPNGETNLTGAPVFTITP